MAGDLNLKKSWNPQLVKNQRKVYEEEQAKLQEYKKIKEKNQELSKHQDYLNLLKLQYGEDFNPADLSKNEKLKLSKTNWMYTDYQPTSEINSSGFNEVNQEFLDGKKKVESLLSGSRSVVTNTSSKINNILNAGKNSVVKSSLDDPLALIKQQRFKSRHDCTKSNGKSDRSERSGTSDRRGDRNRVHKSRSHREDSRSRREGASRSHRDGTSRSHKDGDARSRRDGDARSHKEDSGNHREDSRSHRDSKHSKNQDGSGSYRQYHSSHRDRERSPGRSSKS